MQLSPKDNLFDDPEEKDEPKSLFVALNPFLEIISLGLLYIGPFIYVAIAYSLGAQSGQSVRIGWATYGPSRIWMLIVVFPSMLIWLGILFYFFTDRGQFKLIHAGYFATMTLVAVYYTFFF